MGHTPETIEKIRRNRKGKGKGVAGKYERTPEIRQRISEGVLRAWDEGRRGQGYYCFGRKAGRKVWVRSTWEERVVKVLDLHPCVLDYEVEPFQIPYELDAQSRRYTPDFQLHLEGGIIELWEVKPDRFLDLPMNRAKFAAMNVYAGEKGWNTRIVTLKDIEGMERQVGLKPWKGPGGPWVRPDDPDFRPQSPREQRGE